MTGLGSAAVRAGLPGDAAELARLRFALRADLDTPVLPEPVFLERCRHWMAARLGAEGAWRCWVLEARDSLAGCIWLQLLEKLPNPVGEPEWHGYVSSLYVRPDWRGRGHGSALLRAALAECESRGCDAVFLWPTPRSRSLYLRHGFAVRDDLLERRIGPRGVAEAASW